MCCKNKLVLVPMSNTCFKRGFLRVLKLCKWLHQLICNRLQEGVTYVSDRQLFRIFFQFRTVVRSTLACIWRLIRFHYWEHYSKMDFIMCFKNWCSEKCNLRTLLSFIDNWKSCEPCKKSRPILEDVFPWIGANDSSNSSTIVSYIINPRVYLVLKLSYSQP